MKRSLHKAFSAITILAMVLMALPVQSALAATTITQWTFESPNIPPDATDFATYPHTFAPAVGAGNAGGTHASASTDWTTPVGNGSADSFSTANWAVGDYYQFSVSTLNYTDIMVSWDQTSSNTGPRDFKLAYSTDGTNFTDFGAVYAVLANAAPNPVWNASTSSSLYTISRDLSAVTAVDNQANVYFRLINTSTVSANGGTVAATGTDRVDNFTVSGTSTADAAPSVLNTTPANGATNVPVNTNITVNFSEPVDVAAGAITVECPAGTPVASNSLADNVTSVVIDPASDLPVSTACVANVDDAGVTDEDTNDPPDDMDADFNWSFTTAGAPGASVFFNEIHYDNGGPPDTGEAIEIAGPTCTDLTGWSVVLYNGSGGASYNTTSLSGPIPNLGGGFGVVVVNYPSNGIQNGSPDGMALVDDANNVIQFLSYEGTFTAVGGPANGLLSTDIGVSENGSGPVGDSLRLTGTGSTYNNFTWATTAPNTFGAFNSGQTFTAGGTTNPCGTGAANPDTVFAGDGTLLTVSVISGTNPPSTGLGVTADLSAIGGSSTQVFFDDGTNGDVTMGDNVFSYAATVAMSTSPGLYSLPASVTDAEARTGSASISLTVQPGFVAIHTIQGAAHISPLNGQLVSTAGVVTVVASNGFYLQDPSPDGDDATSEAIFVFTSSAPTVSVGDSVLVNGTVSEFRPGGSSTANLTTTEISSPGLSVSVQSSGNPLPATTVIGMGGRVPPTMIIDDDATGDVETSGTFDAATDGIDFYESMEAMRVQVNNPVAVGPRNSFGEIFVLADDGAGAGVRTTRGGIVIQANDFNPERVQLDDNFTSTPMVDVGDHFTGPAVGVLDYNFGNFEILITSPMTAVSSGLAREATTAADTDELAVASFNVENLDPTDPAEKFEELADLIVNNLQSPDIIAVEEVQDNNGATNDSVVDADVTFGMLIDAIELAGGPTYDFRQINPVSNQDGGEPGGNIRVGFLFRTDRGLAFVDRPGGGSTTATTIVNNGGVPELSSSPGRIDPTNSAFNSSRKPLAGEFTFNDATFFVVVNHFNSKGGDNPLFGHFQPPVLNSEVQRLQQAQVVNDFVDAILAVDSSANVIVAGDLNDFEFSPPVNTVEGGVLNTLMETLPQNERYSYVFEGNSQSLDHILISDSLFNMPFEYDVVHVNAEFADQASDHDPQVVRLLVDNTAPETSIDSNPSNPSNSSSALFTFSGTDDTTAPGNLTFECDLDGGGFSSCTSPQNYTSLSDGSHTFQVRAIDEAGNVDPTPASFTWFVDTTAPTISVAAGGMCASSGGTMNLTVTDANPVTLSGSSSNTTAVPNGNIVFGGSGSNRTVTITGVAGTAIRTATVTITVSDGLNSASTTITVIIGTSTNNTSLNGTSGSDLILGLAGNDKLSGLAGIDLLCGGIGNDTLNGGDNDDTLDGEADNDTINGDNGNDTLRGSNGNDNLNGGAGNDSLSGGNDNDTLTGGANADSFSGGPGNDTNTDFNAGQGDTTDGT